MTHVVEGQLKGIMKEVDKEKALKQSFEVSLNEKTMELNVVKRRATTTDRAWELAEQKAEDRQGKHGESKVKLVEAASLASAYDKELVDLKETMKTCEQVSYNMGFKDAKNLTGAVIFQARKFGFAKGWMATVNAIGLPKTSLSRNVDQILLPEDPQNEAQAQEQPENDSEEEEEMESPSMMELSQQINFHMVVLDEDNPTTTTPIET